MYFEILRKPCCKRHSTIPQGQDSVCWLKDSLISKDVRIMDGYPTGSKCKEHLSTFSRPCRSCISFYWNP